MKGITRKKAEKIVIIAYYTVLNRKPSVIGLTHYVNKLMNDDEFDEVDVYYNLFTSVEYNKTLKKKDGDNGL